MRLSHLLPLVVVLATGCAGAPPTAPVEAAAVPVLATALKPHAMAGQDSPAARRLLPQAGPTEAPADPVAAAAARQQDS